MVMVVVVVAIVVLYKLYLVIAETNSQTPAPALGHLLDAANHPCSTALYFEVPGTAVVGISNPREPQEEAGC